MGATRAPALAWLAPFAERDLARGVRAGRFRLRNRRLALIATGSALLAVMREVLDGRAPQDAARLHVEGVLRLLGVGPAAAAHPAAPATSDSRLALPLSS